MQRFEAIMGGGFPVVRDVFGEILSVIVFPCDSVEKRGIYYPMQIERLEPVNLRRLKIRRVGPGQICMKMFVGSVRLVVFIRFCSCLSLTFADSAVPGHDYKIVYIRAPRYGDDQNTRWPEIKDPIQMEPGADLVLLRPDGTEDVLVKGGNGSVVDPYPSFDGQWIYYSYFPDLRPEALNRQRRNATKAGADIFRIHVPTRRVVRLTHQEFTPNTGVAHWSKNPVRAASRRETYLGYGIFNLGPCPLPGGKVIFTSSRNGYLPNKNFTFPNLQLFVMDDNGDNVELVGHLNLGSALHPTVLTDGRVMFSSYESQGLRDKRLWGLWAIQPDGTEWEPLVSAFAPATAFHFQTQLSRGDVVVEHYYNQNNNGFGSFWSLPPTPPVGIPPFGDPNPRHASNRPFRQGVSRNHKPRMTSVAFSPHGLDGLTAFAFGSDRASDRYRDGEWGGKVTHPSAAPNNDLLLVWTTGPVNDLARPVRTPRPDGGIYRIPGGRKVESHRELVLIRNDPEFNEMQPRPLVPYREIYGVEQPRSLSWLPNDGTIHVALTAGTPFALVGTSSFYKRNTSPGRGARTFNGLDPFNTTQNGTSSNWTIQGADAGRYTDDDIYAVRILAMEPTSHFSYGPAAGRHFMNHANERLRILGEIPLRKHDAKGRQIVDPEGNPDTSFLAKIPADVPFTFQTLDRDGLVLNMSQTWHQVRPGEVRHNCGGCHAHAQKGLNFELTFAARDDYKIVDLTGGATLLGRTAEGGLAMRNRSEGAIDVEYYRDIKPILKRSCVKCHTNEYGRPAAELILNDEQIVGGYENTYHRLANDSRARYGRKPVIRSGSWRQTNASRYIRKFQSRRSLLVWKIYGRRMDGWTNSDHPTETTPGDPGSLPKGNNPNEADIDFVGTIMPPPDSAVPRLTANDRLTIARWVDLGCPISRHDKGHQKRGWFLDELRPTLTLSAPRVGSNARLDHITIGMHDYYSGLDEESLSVTSDFAIDGVPPQQDLAGHFRKIQSGIWQWKLHSPIDRLARGKLTITVRDLQGNTSRIERTFSIGHQSASRYRNAAQQ